MIEFTDTDIGTMSTAEKMSAAKEIMDELEYQLMWLFEHCKKHKETRDPTDTW